MTRMPGRFGDDGGPWWPSFVAGAVTGLAAGLILRSLPGPAGGGGRGAAGGLAEGWSRLRLAWDDAVDGASDGLASARQLVVPEPEVDATALEEMLAESGAAAGCRVRVLSDGIVEVVGSCASDRDLAGVLDALAAAPGVEVVVNRVWTPDSSGSGEASAGKPAH